ncbi:MAG: PHP domain-containing protein [Treponema sp.]|jgi:predicted metal-dependent phosphoesterase TrpH|nr:PHP domain-containing protein [Treponema sp.]
MIDLHTHSTASDGNLSPSALVTEALKHGISTLALTDHDTIDGLEEAAKAASEQSIGFIPGIELEIAQNPDQRGEFHLLGLGINKPSSGFLAAVKELTRRRQERNMGIVEKMNKAGIATSYDEIKSFAKGPSVGRPHFADFLVQRRIAKNREQAFLRYLGREKPFFIPKAGLEFERSVALIRESGGIAVLAHPMSLFVSWGKLPDMVKKLKEKGLDGLEAWHPTAKVSACKRLELLGKKLELYITAGSDFHGEKRPGRKLGITAGGRKIDELILETIPALQRQRFHDT